MTISFSSFLSQLLSSPVLAVTVVLTLGVILVNGWTDAPQRHRHLCLHKSHRPEGGNSHGGVL